MSGAHGAPGRYVLRARYYRLLDTDGAELVAREDDLPDLGIIAQVGPPGTAAAIARISEGARAQGFDLIGWVEIDDRLHGETELDVDARAIVALSRVWAASRPAAASPAPAAPSPAPPQPRVTWRRRRRSDGVRRAT